MSTSMLVGYTGFVGSNIDASHDFTWRINTKNTNEAIGKQPDLLIFAGLRAEKFLANSNPEEDLKRILDAMEQIKQIAPKRLVLISTIDVYDNPVQVRESTVIQTEQLQPYGKNRYLLEQWVREYQSNTIIIRLPGLFGRNIRKNFIYDYIHVIPFLLKKDKYIELSSKNNMIRDSYEDAKNGFFKYIVSTNEYDIIELKNAFQSVGFSALNFTDSRSVFQFYPLERLWNDIQIALKNDIRLLNVATEPVSVSEVYEYLSGKRFANVLSSLPAYYDYRSDYADLFGGTNGYFIEKEAILKQIKKFVEEQI